MRRFGEVQHWLRPLALAALLGSALAQRAEAVEVLQVSPQGEVGQVQNVAVRFKEPAAAFGDPRLPDPVDIQCGRVEVKGKGRWTSDREWVFDFVRPLPAGANCRVKAKADFQPTAPGASANWIGKREFAFQIAAPTVRQIRPWDGSRIEEDQRFLLQLTGEAKQSTIAGNVWCESQSLGERVPAQLYPDAEKDALLKSLKMDSAKGAGLGAARLQAAAARGR